MASGKNKGLTQTYYDNNPDANKRRLAQQKRYDSNNPKATQRRVAANKGNRAAGTYGNGDGKDFSHTSKKLVTSNQQVKTVLDLVLVKSMLKSATQTLRLHDSSPAYS